MARQTLRKSPIAFSPYLTSSSAFSPVGRQRARRQQITKLIAKSTSIVLLCAIAFFASLGVLAFFYGSAADVERAGQSCQP